MYSTDNARRSGTAAPARSGPGHKPTVSILIPAFNAQRWLAATLRSAVSQTWEPKEIIVVDDGSSDATLAIAREFECDGVRVVTQLNQGAAAARNKALSLSRGEYIQWLDADDLLAPDKIARQMEIVGQYPSNRTLFSSAWGRFMHRPNRAQFIPSALWCDLSAVEWLLRKLEQNLWMQTSTWLVSRELAELAGPWDVRMMSDDDGEYFCRVLMASDGVRFVPDAKVYYRQTGSSSLSYMGRSDRKLDALYLSIELHVKYIRSLEESPRVRAACMVFLQNWFVYFYPERPDLVERMETIASELGGRLKTPTISWKYSWLQSLFGWNFAKRAQLLSSGIRWSLARYCDSLAFRIQSGRPLQGRQMTKASRVAGNAK